MISWELAITLYIACSNEFFQNGSGSHFYIIYVHLIRFVPSMKFTSWLSFGFYPPVLGFKIGDATDKENLLPFGITIGVASSGMRIKLYFTPIFNLSQYFD
jgi:hypothetical protein